jgi:F-type H+-transporting ATPase subunit b
MKKLSLALILAGSPALAETEAFFTLRSTEFVVTVAFLLFIGLLVYLKVPGVLGGMLDKRAAGIKADLESAKALHEEAKALLLSYEKKHKEVQEQADLIVTSARREAMDAAEQAKADLKTSIARDTRPGGSGRGGGGGRPDRAPDDRGRPRQADRRGHRRRRGQAALARSGGS